MKTTFKFFLLTFLAFQSKSYAQFTGTSGQITQVTTGNVGIGILTPTAPLCQLEVKNGSVLFDGTTGITPISGAGSRMMWIPAKKAFRAGNVGGTQWDDANIGIYSIALGDNPTASNTRAIAMGQAPTASGQSSISIGINTLASAQYSSAFGFYSTSSGINSLSMGVHSTSTASASIAIGSWVTAQSYESMVVGQYNVISGTNTWVATEPLFVIGNGASAVAPNNALTVLKNGNTGINTTTPEDLLQVGAGISKVAMGSAYGANIGYGNSYIGFNASRQQTTGTWSTSVDGVGGNSGGALIYGDVTGGIRFSTIPATSTNQTGITDATIKNNIKMEIQANGNVNIGATGLPTNTYKLNVCGDIRAKKVVITTGWCDFVFKKDYKLRTLEETEKYINENGHLPEIPSASEIEENGGDLGALVKLQMQKIEELTLYLIEQNKKIEQLSKQNMLLKGNSNQE